MSIFVVNYRKIIYYDRIFKWKMKLGALESFGGYLKAEENARKFREIRLWVNTSGRKSYSPPPESREMDA
jgi:hypothetical protein